MGLIAHCLRGTVASLFLYLATGVGALGYVSCLCFASAIALVVYGNCTAVCNPPKSSPVPIGKIRICVAGFTHSGPTAKAHYLADLIARSNPAKYESWYYFDSFAFYPFTKAKFDSVPFPPHLKGHATSPFCWLERTPNIIEPLGGSDHLSNWALDNIQDKAVRDYAAKTNILNFYLTGSAFHTGEGRPVATAAPA